MLRTSLRRELVHSRKPLTPSASPAMPATMASAKVPTRIVRSTKGTPKAEARLNTGMMGNTSSLPQLR